MFSLVVSASAIYLMRAFVFVDLLHFFFACIFKKDFIWFRIQCLFFEKLDSMFN
jgi:hypothetical protein